MSMLPLTAILYLELCSTEVASRLGVSGYLDCACVEVVRPMLRASSISHDSQKVPKYETTKKPQVGGFASTPIMAYIAHVTSINGEACGPSTRSVR